MSIEPGTMLGPYEIDLVVGVGGMGEVYRARDTRLDRAVAIKVLAPHLAERPEHRERLEREAKAVSSLSHPHICPLYDVGHENGVDFLVMEFIEGETLADKLARGPLPIDKVLRYGVQIADALEKAHRQGIVHRDLKPGNVMLTTDGTKLLDFGLARTDAVAGTGGGAEKEPRAAGVGSVHDRDAGCRPFCGGLFPPGARTTSADPLRDSPSRGACHAGFTTDLARRSPPGLPRSRFERQCAALAAADEQRGSTTAGGDRGCA
jgi:serine/threonine protein kinase